MGNHKDSQTVEFIEELRKKGEKLGFQATTELPKMKRSYSIDLVWSPYDNSHEIFITFEIESKENDRLCKNFDKIFDTQSKDFEKPYYHFVIVCHGKLTKGNRDLMLEKARNKNVHVFEDIINDIGAKKRLFEELEHLQISITQLIEKRGKVNPAQTVQETIMGLERVTPCYILDNHSHNLNQATITSMENTADKPIALQPNQLFNSKKYRQFAFVPIPRQEYVLLIPGTSFSIDLYLDITIGAKNTELFAETVNYPFIIQIIKSGNSSKIQFNYDPKDTDFVQLEFFEKIAIIFDLARAIKVVDAKEKVVFHGGRIGPDKEKSTKEYIQIISDTARVQRIIGRRILVPEKEFSQENIKNLKKIMQVIDSSGLAKIDDLKEITYSMNGKDAKDMLESNPSGIFNSDKMEDQNFSITLFNQKIKLGKLIADLPELRFRDGQDYFKLIRDCREDKEIKIELVPVLSTKAILHYPDWEENIKKP